MDSLDLRPINGTKKSRFVQEMLLKSKCQQTLKTPSGRTLLIINNKILLLQDYSQYYTVMTSKSCYLPTQEKKKMNYQNHTTRFTAGLSEEGGGVE